MYLLKSIICGVQMVLNSFVIKFYFSPFPLYRLLTACLIFDVEHHLCKWT